MSLVRFDLGSEIDDLRREVNRIFAGFPLMTSGYSEGLSRWLPAMDTVEEGGKLNVMIDVPGMAEEDLDVEVSDNVLTIRGKREIKREQKDQRWYRFERSTGNFERSLEMPERIDPDSVHASFDKGVLTVSLPSRKPVSTGQHIQITSGT